MKRLGRWLGYGVLAILFSGAWAQRRSDPLNALEIDELRDAAQEPEKRLKLYAQFARERLASLEKVRADPKSKDRGQQTHDWLEQFMVIYDELDNNVDTFADRREDLRKALKPVIEADAEFQAKLRALRDSAEAGKDEAKTYEFVLTSAIEAVDNGVRDHRQLLVEQEEAFKKKKKSKP